MQLAHSTSVAGHLTHVLLRTCACAVAHSITTAFVFYSQMLAVKSQLSSIAVRATQAHILVTELTRDVQELDVTKRNLTLAIEVSLHFL
jgi:hypothetical protein